MNALEVDNLRHRFGGVAAVDGVSWAARCGEILAVIGPNGAGKTTLFNLITGVYRPTGGQIRVFGRPVAGLPPHVVAGLGVARTFQHPRIFAGWTVRENVLVGTLGRHREGWGAAVLALPSARRVGRAARAAADRALMEVGLADLAEAPAEQLTTGQERLADLARCLAGNPRILLLDEPAAGLSGPETQALAAVLRRVAGPERAMVLVEHDMSLVFGVADRVVVLDQGRVLAQGPPSEVAADPAVREAYLGQGGTDHVTA